MIDRFVHADDRAGLRAAIATAAARQSEGATVDYRLLVTGGTTLHVRALLSSGTAGRVRAIGIDVTRQRELELELRQAQKLESVGRLAAGVAHEINTPIQFVSDSIEFVRDASGDLLGVLARHQATSSAVLSSGNAGDAARAALAAEAETDIPHLTAEIPAALDRAIDGLGRVAAIVKSMKQVAYPERREMTAVDLNAALRSTLTIARSEYRYVADLHTDFAELPPVTCHPGDINQAVLNLVVNAAHAIADVVGDSGAKGMITVRTRRDGDHAVITVGDTGGGIPDHVRERMFDPFFTTKDVGRGTGQGLAIARAMIVDTHRGALTCDTEVGRGTIFTLRLPIGGCIHRSEEIAA